MFRKNNRFVKQLCVLAIISNLMYPPISPTIINNAQDCQAKPLDKKVSSITIKGENLVCKGMVRNYLAFHEGSIFSEDAITQSIKNLEATGYFNNIQIFKSETSSDSDKLDILVKVEEKALLVGYEFEGNSQLSAKKLAEVSGIKDAKAVSSHDIKNFQNTIINEYRRANNHNVDVEVVINYSKDKTKKVYLTFKCNEGAKTQLKEVKFIGCDNVLESALASKLMTKEDWFLSSLDGAGRFTWELLEIDKSNIQRYYADKGYYKATAVDTLIDKNVKNNEVAVTFVVKEGELHRIRFLDLPKDDTYSEEFLSNLMLIKQGNIYNASKLVDSMERIKNLYGSKGYVFCNVYPEIRPVIVDGEHFVDIELCVEKGTIYKINEIRITGNIKTRDYVLRRELAIQEGSIANKVAMDMSLVRLESLGYFDRNLDWKIIKVGDDLVDLELHLKEIKTGSGNLGLTVSQERGSSYSSLKVAADIRKRNYKGLGWDVGASIAGGENRLQKLEFDFRNPAIWNANAFFNSKISMNTISYNELGPIMNESPSECTAGASCQLGLYLFPSTLKLATSLDLSCNSVSFSTLKFKKEYEKTTFAKTIARDRFKNGIYTLLGCSVGQNYLNHPLYPSGGWTWNVSARSAFPILFNKQYSMFKTELTSRYFAPIIGRDKLVFSAMLKVGRIFEVNENQPIPFQELYLAGGADSIRGFRWGEAGPENRKYNSPLGGKKELIARFELITPAGVGDASTDTPRAYVFYDIGSAWDTPVSYTMNEGTNTISYVMNEGKRVRSIPETDIIKNNFNLRHTVGFGFRMTAPQPVRIEWGYKLDRKALSKERPSEWHLTMNMPFDF